MHSLFQVHELCSQLHPLGIQEMTDTNGELLKQLPKVDRLLSDPRIVQLTDLYPRTLVVEMIRQVLDGIRDSIRSGSYNLASVDDEAIVERILDWAGNTLGRSLKRAVNGAGIILHTGLGRAPLSRNAREALAETVEGYCTLQLDQYTGKRGDRYAHVESLLTRLTGAEAALVVNNNAAATLLILNTLAGGKEVLVSRGELVEIGGSFRIPDVMRRSGAKLIEVGATNRTHLKDYAEAVTPMTGLILKVHQSNYRIVGFSKQVPIDDLAGLGQKLGIPVVDDLGSGALVDLSRWNLPKEPTAQESIIAGADVVCFSGDKLLGGPQCGIIIGKKPFIEQMKKNQLTRALRACKMTYAVLEATLRLFLDEDTLMTAHPVLRMLTESVEDVKKRCRSLSRKLKPIIEPLGNLNLVEDETEIGSGSLATETLPTWVVSIAIPGLSTEDLARMMRLCRPPIFGRVKEGRYVLDCRTLNHEEFDMVASAMRTVLDSGSGTASGSAGTDTVADKIVQQVREIDDETPGGADSTS